MTVFEVKRFTDEDQDSLDRTNAAEAARRKRPAPVKKRSVPTKKPSAKRPVPKPGGRVIATQDPPKTKDSDYESKHPRNPDGTFAYKNDTGTGDAKKGAKDAGAKDDGKVHGRISAAQQVLVKAGLLKATDGRKGQAIDGYYGPKTEAAVKLYQSKNKLKATGVLDAATQKAMGVTSKDTTQKKDGSMNISYKTAAVGGITVDSEEDGILSAVVSVTGIKDKVNDIIVPGAYGKSLQTRTPKGVWSHDWDKPIAKTLAIEELMPGHKDLPKTLSTGDPWPREAGALMVKMQFNLNTQRGRDAYEDVKFYDTDAEWSVGYNVPTGAATLEKGIRNIKAMDLYEYSPVLFGAMPSARTTSVKEAQMAYKSLLDGVTFDSIEDWDGWLVEMKSFAESTEMETKEDTLVEEKPEPVEVEAASNEIHELSFGDVDDNEASEDEEADDQSVNDEEDEFDGDEDYEDDDSSDDDDEEDDDEDEDDVDNDGAPLGTELLDFDDDDDDDISEGKSLQVGSVSAERVQEVISSLQGLLAGMQSPSDEAKDMEPVDEWEYKGLPTTDTLADAVETLGDDIDDDVYNSLMDWAEAFDAGLMEQDEEVIEESATQVLDVIADSEDEGRIADTFSDIAGVIVDHMEAFENGEPPQEKGLRYARTYAGAERYGVGLGIRIDAKVYALGTDETKIGKGTNGKHGIDWIWEDEDWADYPLPKVKAPKKAAASKPDMRTRTLTPAEKRRAAAAPKARADKPRGVAGLDRTAKVTDKLEADRNGASKSRSQLHAATVATHNLTPAQASELNQLSVADVRTYRKEKAIKPSLSHRQALRIAGGTPSTSRTKPTDAPAPRAAGVRKPTAKQQREAEQLRNLMSSDRLEGGPNAARKRPTAGMTSDQRRYAFAERANPGATVKKAGELARAWRDNPHNKDPKKNFSTTSGLRQGDQVTDTHTGRDGYVKEVHGANDITVDWGGFTSRIPTGDINGASSTNHAPMPTRGRSDRDERVNMELLAEPKDSGETLANYNARIAELRTKLNAPKGSTRAQLSAMLEELRQTKKPTRTKVRLKTGEPEDMEYKKFPPTTVESVAKKNKCSASEKADLEGMSIGDLRKYDMARMRKKSHDDALDAAGGSSGSEEEPDDKKGGKKSFRPQPVTIISDIELKSLQDDAADMSDFLDSLQ